MIDSYLGRTRQEAVSLMGGSLESREALHQLAFDWFSDMTTMLFYYQNRRGAFENNVYRDVETSAALSDLTVKVFDVNTTNQQLADLILRCDLAVRDYFQNNPSELPNNSPAREPANYRTSDSDEMVTISHGGGYFYIQAFLSGKKKGYWITPKYDRGILVHINPGKSASKNYASRIDRRINLDVPACLLAEIPRKYLIDPDRYDEYMLTSDSIKHLQNVRIQRMDVNP